ncbi:MAG: polyprenyl synthetase family protein [Deltaproteobacteria bacterium]|jgi:geranylgeranyl diphosphate synthase type II|nr:polyprenyl synthetase family protein [Deltaproteobacteria bacterium]
MQEAPNMDLVREALKREAGKVDLALAGLLTNPAIPEGLRASMRYSLLAGGKRLRPVLCLLCARLFGLAEKTALPCALALECLHTYSLIHDDLPAMDNDDLRRGKPSNHKKFGEAAAILAGDALLTDAFTLMAATKGAPAKRLLAAIRVVGEAAGSSGMAGGQFLDISYTALEGLDLEQIAAMQALKTGALLKASCLAGAILAGAEGADLAAVGTYGQALGAAFQIADDILDATGSEEELGKPVGGDAAGKKATLPSLLGLKKSANMAEAKAAEAQEALRHFQGETAALLRGLAVYTVRRIT